MRRRLVLDLLNRVHLPRTMASRRPRHLSGGRKQRGATAGTFAGQPELVGTDEPVVALDVSVQAAVLALLLDVQRTHGATLLVISHDFGAVRYLVDRVMFLGQVMERRTTAEVLTPPHHLYPEALLAATPLADRPGQQRLGLDGPVPSVIAPPRGCPLVSRCPRRLGTLCEAARPLLRQGTATHSIACHLPLDRLTSPVPAP